jgi:hypothetical protein
LRTGIYRFSAVIFRLTNKNNRGGAAMAKKNVAEIIEERKKMAEDLSVFMIKGTTVESRVFLNRIIRFDNGVKYLRGRLGLKNFDTAGAMELINRCNRVGEDFKQLVLDIEEFIQKQKNNSGNSGTNDGNGVEESTAETVEIRTK